MHACAFGDAGIMVQVWRLGLAGDDGATVMTDILFPNEDYTLVKVYAENGSVQLKSGVFYEVKSIWE